MSLLIGELGEKVLVDAAEHIAGYALEFVRVERADKLAQDLVVEFLVFALGKDAAQILVITLDGFHRFDDSPGPVIAVGQGNEVIELGLGLKEDGALLREVRFGERACYAATHGQIGYDCVLDA